MIHFHYAGAFAIVLTPSKDQVHVTFENVAGNCTFTCSGNGAFVVWTVDGFDANHPHVINKGISVLPTVVSPDGRNITAQLSVPTIKSNNNTSVVCTQFDDASYRNTQSTDPVLLLIQGKIHVFFQETPCTNSKRVIVQGTVHVVICLNLHVHCYLLCNFANFLIKYTKKPCKINVLYNCKKYFWC